MLVAELFFGRDIAGRAPLSEAEWRAFAAEIVTPNFPDGFTAFDAEGQWRNPATGTIARDRQRCCSSPRRAAPISRARLSAVDRGLQDPVPPAIGRDHHARFLRRVLMQRAPCRHAVAAAGVGIRRGSSETVMKITKAVTASSRNSVSNPQPS